MGEYKDLSECHHQVSALFKWPESREEWEQYKLSEEQLDCYRQHGYVSGLKFLDDAQIEILRNEKWTDNFIRCCLMVIKIWAYEDTLLLYNMGAKNRQLG